MVEGTGLENQQVNSLAGSNPALSARLMSSHRAKRGLGVA